MGHQLSVSLVVSVGLWQYARAPDNLTRERLSLSGERQRASGGRVRESERERERLQGTRVERDN